MKLNHIHQGDCLEVLKTFPANSIDSIVTDPPAGISYQGKEWDTFDRAMFGKAGDEGENDLKVLKGFKILPRYDGGDLGAFQDFICLAFTEAIRVIKPGGHALVWSIPRTSHHTAMGLERAGFEIRDCVFHVFGTGFVKNHDISKAIDKSVGAKREVIGKVKRSQVCSAGFDRPYKHLAMERDKSTVTEYEYTAPATKEAKKWDGWGTALKPAVECWWLCRKPIEEKTVAKNIIKYGTGGINTEASKANGRHPANVTHDGTVPAMAALPYFYCAKSSPSERGINNTHPTVKPEALMQYFIKLITPPDGIVLDMFAGSGTTLLAAQALGFRWIGIEKDPKSVGIAWDRLESEFGLFLRRA